MTIREEIIRRLDLGALSISATAEEKNEAINHARDATDQATLLHLFTRMAWAFFNEAYREETWRVEYEHSVDGTEWQHAEQWPGDPDELIAIMRAQNADPASTERHRNVKRVAITTTEGPAETVDT